MKVELVNSCDIQSELNFQDKQSKKKYVLYAQIASSQESTGITSKVGKFHMVFWDIERIKLSEAVRVLRKVQEKYNLSNIYLSSDYPKSYHAWCFSLVPFETMMKILVDSRNILDWGFFVWTVRRKAATLRLSQKKGRPFQKVIKCVRSYYVAIPEKIVKVNYTTGEEKFPQKILEVSK